MRAFIAFTVLVAVAAVVAAQGVPRTAAPSNQAMVACGAVYSVTANGSGSSGAATLRLGGVRPTLHLIVLTGHPTSDPFVVVRAGVPLF